MKDFILVFIAIVIYLVIILKSRALYSNSDDLPIWMGLLLALAVFLIADVFYTNILKNIIYQRVALSPQLPDENFDIYSNRIISRKTVNLVFYFSGLISFLIGYLLTFLGKNLELFRGLMLWLILILIAVLIITYVGFKELTSGISAVLGIIATSLGIFASIKTLSRKEKA